MFLLIYSIFHFFIDIINQIKPMKQKIIPLKNKTLLIGCSIFVVYPIPIISQPNIRIIIDITIFDVILIF